MFQFYSCSALDLGFDMLELDCQLTMDKKVVVAHDDHLGRVSGIDTLISETKYEVSDFKK